jgi:hypothetical protein
LQLCSRLLPNFRPPLARLLPAPECKLDSRIYDDLKT